MKCYLTNIKIDGSFFILFFWSVLYESMFEKNIPSGLQPKWNFTRSSEIRFERFLFRSSLFRPKRKLYEVLTSSFDYIRPWFRMVSYFLLKDKACVWESIMNQWPIVKIKTVSSSFWIAQIIINQNDGFKIRTLVSGFLPSCIICSASPVTQDQKRYNKIRWSKFTLNWN